MSPAGGLGAVLAIHDSVTLANWLSTLRMATEEDVEKVFKKYRAEIYPVAKETFQTSQIFIRDLGMVKRFTDMRDSTMFRKEEDCPHRITRTLNRT